MPEYEVLGMAGVGGSGLIFAIWHMVKGLTARLEKIDEKQDRTDGRVARIEGYLFNGDGHEQRRMR